MKTGQRIMNKSSIGSIASDSSSGDRNFENQSLTGRMDIQRSKFPFCIVWTPIPLLTWLFPIVGHMGIAYSTGVIRDFAGPYFVSEDDMAFGKPTKYMVMDPNAAQGGIERWDTAILEASEIYKTRMHYLLWDNCHSHCSKALNLMNYKRSRSWNMVWLAGLMFLKGKYVSFGGFLKTWIPFMIIITIIVLCSVFI